MSHTRTHPHTHTHTYANKRERVRTDSATLWFRNVNRVSVAHSRPLSQFLLFSFNFQYIREHNDDDDECGIVSTLPQMPKYPISNAGRIDDIKSQTNTFVLFYSFAYFYIGVYMWNVIGTHKCDHISQQHFLHKQFFLCANNFHWYPCFFANSITYFLWLRTHVFMSSSCGNFLLASLFLLALRCLRHDNHFGFVDREI